MAGEARTTYDVAGPNHAPRAPGPEGGGVEVAGAEANRALRLAVAGVAAAVERARDRGHDADGRDLATLRDRVRLYERLAGLATTGMADALAGLREAGGMERDGAASTAEWVKANTARSGRDAARLSRLATDLDDLPATRDALTSGAISDEAADVIVRAARDGRLGPVGDVDQALAQVATASSPEELRADVKVRQQAADAAAMVRDENEQHARRTLRLWRKETGMWGMSGDLPDEVGQRFRTALDAFDHPDAGATGPERRRRPEQRLADALDDLVGAVLDRGLAPTTGGITRPHLSVIVHASTVSTDLADPAADHPDDPTTAPALDDPRWASLAAGDLPWGGTLSPQAVRRICCDAAVSRVVMAGESQVLDVGRETRNWSGPQRRAVNARDRACRGPNCTRPIAWTSVHHLQWWRQGGPTSVDNGLALCHHCHRLVHDRGWTVDLERDTAAATWTSPGGTVIVTTPRAGPADHPGPGRWSTRAPGEHPGAAPPTAGARAGPPGAGPPGTGPPGDGGGRQSDRAQPGPARPRRP